MCWMHGLTPHNDARPDNLVTHYQDRLIDISDYMLYKIDRSVGTSRLNLTRIAIFFGASATLRL
jgi:hypothetical protein